MHGLIETNTEQLVKRKNWSKFNSNNKTSKKVVLDPQEKTLETQPSINHQKQKWIQRQKQKTKLQFEAENEIWLLREQCAWTVTQNWKRKTLKFFFSVNNLLLLKSWCCYIGPHPQSLQICFKSKPKNEIK